MTERKELPEVEILVAKAGSLISRLNDLTAVFACKGLDKDRVDSSAGRIRDLSRIVDKLAGDADEYERVLEALEPSRYLQWLMSVPADSALFRGRRRGSSRRRTRR